MNIRRYQGKRELVKFCHTVQAFIALIIRTVILALVVTAGILVLRWAWKLFEVLIGN